MEQIRHPLGAPWINAIPFLCFKLGAAQGYLDPTKVTSKQEWFEKAYPIPETKMAEDIIQPNVARVEGNFE